MDTKRKKIAYLHACNLANITDQAKRMYIVVGLKFRVCRLLMVGKGGKAIGH